MEKQRTQKRKNKQTSKNGGLRREKTNKQTKMEDASFPNTKRMVQTIIIKISQTHRIRGWWLLGADRSGKCGSNGQRVQTSTL